MLHRYLLFFFLHPFSKWCGDCIIIVCIISRQLDSVACRSHVPRPLKHLESPKSLCSKTSVLSVTKQLDKGSWLQNSLFTYYMKTKLPLPSSLRVTGLLSPNLRPLM